MVVVKAGLTDEGVVAGLEGDGGNVVVADDALIVHVHIALWFLCLFVLLLGLERCCFDVCLSC